MNAYANYHTNLAVRKIQDTNVCLPKHPDLKQIALK